jgi:hypothetical protein
MSRGAKGWRVLLTEPDTGVMDSSRVCGPARLQPRNPTDAECRLWMELQ